MPDEPRSGTDLAKLAELKRDFDSIPHVRGLGRATPCPNGCGMLSERDRVGPGMASFDVTTLFHCDKCGYYEIGDTYYTWDY